MGAGSGPRARPLLRLLINRPHGPRIFAEAGCELPQFRLAAEILGRFASTVIEADDPVQWKIRFSHRGHNFTVERIDGGHSAYIVDDPSCPDEILIEIMGELDTRFAESVPRPVRRKLYGINLAIGIVAIGLVIALAVAILLAVSRAR
jgi:hypothetical protein